MTNVATIERTVDASTDRRIYIDLPESVPHGQVHIIVRYEPLPEQFSRKDIDARRDIAKSLVGILKGNTTTYEPSETQRRGLSIPETTASDPKRPLAQGA